MLSKGNYTEFKLRMILFAYKCMFIVAYNISV